jgi:hypothetical protein
MLANRETARNVLRYRMKLSPNAKTRPLRCLVPQPDKVDKLILSKQ